MLHTSIAIDDDGAPSTRRASTALVYNNTRPSLVKGEVRQALVRGVVHVGGGEASPSSGKDRRQVLQSAEKSRLSDGAGRSPWMGMEW